LPRSQQPATGSDWLFAGEAVPPKHVPKYIRKNSRCGTSFERQGWRAGFRTIAGVDEVGRGALFGPVLAAAVILDPARPIRGLRDSKQLSARERERLNEEIRRRALAWSVAAVDAEEIDRINIYQASRLAMRLAVLQLNPPPELVLVDALRLDLQQAQVPIIHGDARSVSIAAASIVAKVERDRLLVEWHRVYPQYHLASNKGYATAAHRAMLRQQGPTPLHRKSFAPVAAARQVVPQRSWPLFPAIM